MKKIFLIYLFCISTAFAAPISLDIQSIHLASAVRLLAGYANLNVIVSPEVHGEVSLRVSNEESQNVFDSLLLSNGLAKTRQGGIWYIAPRLEMIKVQQEEAMWRLGAESSSALSSRSWKIRYARAADVAVAVQENDASLLSERGHLSVDARTNLIFVRDTPARLAVINQLISRMDIAVQQVLIEARLVSIDQDAMQQLGFEFSVRQLAATDPHPVAGNLPAPGKYSIAVASLPDGSWLDVKLAALEQQGRAELISSPSLFTGSQQEASIEAGEEVPYQEVSESGGTAVAFKKAVLGLKVTPQILPGSHVLLALKINQDRPAARMVQGVPAISTRQIVTNVQVKSGQTVVLGGIYEVNHEQSQEGLPFLGNIPIIGLLFTQQSQRYHKRELLIFVTPKIMQQAI
jgi:type IV pilus assembly protein PilQ